MKLSFEQISEFTTGAVRIKELNGETHLYRFSEEQENLYKERDWDFYNKTFCTAGIRLSFLTNSSTLFLKLNISTKESTRKYFSVDVFVDGVPVDYIDNFSNIALPIDYTQADLPDGHFAKQIRLGDGMKKVCIYLPRMAVVAIEDIIVDDGAFVEPIKPSKKLLVFGDSITQGYDALRPSNHYIAKLANAFDVEEFNVAIGGEIFFPELIDAAGDLKPDYIIVGYGTNDWSKTEQPYFKENCQSFFKSLYDKYPSSQICVLTPIWRRDYEEAKPFGSFFEVEAIIKNICSNYSTISVVEGWDMVPHSENYYADLRLHPNDKGFEYYYKNLKKAFEKIIV